MGIPMKSQHNEYFPTNLATDREGVSWPPNANITTHKLRRAKTIVGGVPIVALMIRAQK